MGAIADALRQELTHVEFSEGYAESFLDSYIATQIKVLREQRQMTQSTLAARINTTQTVISRIENASYSGWNVGTLKRLARAFELRLRVSFEEYGTLPEEVEEFSRKALQRAPRSADSNLIRAEHPSDEELARFRRLYGSSSNSSEDNEQDTKVGPFLIRPANAAREASRKAESNTTNSAPKKGAALEGAGGGQYGTRQGIVGAINQAV
jgi:transcriptional regulator with XRE-family HTH domain